MNARDAFPAVGVALIIGVLLFWTQAVLKPLALAALLAMILTPVVKVLEHRGIKRTPATLLAAALALIAIVVFGVAVAYQLVALVSDLGAYERALQDKLSALGASENLFSRLAQIVSNALKTTNELLSSGPAPTQVIVVSGPLERLLSALTPWLAAAGTAGIVAVLCVFFMLKRDDLSDRIVKLAGQRRIGLTTRALDDAGQRISRYLSVFSALNLAYGAAVAGGLALIGLPLALLWGAIAGVLRFVPYIGAALGFAGPMVLALIVFPGWEQPLLVVALYAVLEAVLVAVVEPLVYGKSTGVSPIALLVAALFWTWLWGPLGLLLSTPLTVSLAVAGKYVPGLSGMATLLGDTPSLAPHLRLYQRLLAGDSFEVKAMVSAAVEQDGLERVLDELLRPTVEVSARDAAAGAISPRERNRLWRELDDLLDELEWERKVDVAVWAPDREIPRAAMLGLYENEPEHLVLRMLNLLLEGPRTILTLASAASTHGFEQAVAAREPRVLVIALASGAAEEALGAAERIATLSPATPVLTLGAESTLGGVLVQNVATLAEARDQLLTIVLTDEEVRDGLEHALRESDLARAERQLKRILRTHAFDRVHLRILDPLLRRLEASASRSSANTLAALQRLLEQLLRDQTNAVRSSGPEQHRVLVACPNERAEPVDLVLLTVTLRARGYDVLYVGTTVSVNDLPAVARRMHPRVVVIGGRSSRAAAEQLSDLPSVFVTEPSAGAAMPGNTHRLPRTAEAALQAIENAMPPRSVPPREAYAQPTT